MKEGYITFNEATKRYEIDGQGLHCGNCIDIWDGENWLSCRIEYSDNWNHGYYLLVFDKEGNHTGSIPLWDKSKGRID